MAAARGLKSESGLWLVDSWRPADRDESAGQSSVLYWTATLLVVCEGVGELKVIGPCGIFKTWSSNFHILEGPSRGMASSLGLAKY